MAFSRITHEPHVHVPLAAWRLTALVPPPKKIAANCPLLYTAAHAAAADAAALIPAWLLLSPPPLPYAPLASRSRRPVSRLCADRPNINPFTFFRFFSNNFCEQMWFCLEVYGLVVGGHAGLLEGLGHGRVRVAGARDVLAARVVLERDDGLGDHLPRLRIETLRN